MIREISFITLLAVSNFFVNGSVASAQHSPNIIRCEPIGRILNTGDLGKKKGSSICPKDNLKPKEGQKVKILCYLNRKVLELGEGAVDDSPDKCVKSSSQDLHKCTPQNQSKCPRTRSQQAKHGPIITYPYGNFILADTSLLLSWQPISKATTYTITLNGKGIDWSEQTSSTKLVYSGESPIISGNIYKLNIIANENNSPISASSTILIVLSEREAEQIKLNTKKIQNFDLTLDEKARDLDTLYGSYNLLTESIRILSQRINSGSNSPNLHRLLGDRYMEAGFPGKAKPLYAKANKLAQKFNHKIEQKLAQKGLEQIGLLKKYSTTNH